MAAMPNTAPSVPAGKLAPALKLVKAGPDSQIGTPVRVFGLIVVIAALAGGLGMFVLGGTASSAAAPKVIIPLKDRKPAGATPATAAPAATATPAATPAAAPAATAKPAARKPAAAAPKPDDGLPAKLSAALAANRVVVVSLYSPRSSVAEMARAEAQAGAKAAGVGFVALNAYAQKEVAELTATLDVISDPSILVYVRPNTLAGRLDGFADAELVAALAATAAAAR